MDSILQETAGRAPSVLNGGLGEVSPVFWLALLAGFASLESNTLDYQVTGWQSEGKSWKYTPGDYSFDPLDLQDKIADKWMISSSKWRSPAAISTPTMPRMVGVRRQACEGVPQP